ncbi:MAG: thioredoxin [Candidatus Xiphinematobacter sp.]|nr:MAG: thioredoxin [Candidatus Xiphinematobacter sp.]QQY09419.1 MAG: thioredoxin [Candidatus Xiphinematobacter sp.]QQY10168.1 MAG: thioredoxin [Candidatus Xiphinematobacter sp.]QQY10904.1 MAG: thioredoxin [Candidatus Xiphinematobacter sp.]QQY11647.1 MAG: thioredoxin [Candidatus Xiphinematobacter sp.]
MQNNSVITITESNFESLVIQATLPVLVDFWAPWCGPCRMLEPVISQIALQVQGRAVAGKVNIDENPSTARRFHVQAVPQVLFFLKGEVKDRSVGYVSQAVLLSKLEAIILASGL